MTHPDLPSVRRGVTPAARRRRAICLAGLAFAWAPLAAAQTQPPDAPDAPISPDAAGSGPEASFDAAPRDDASSIEIELTAGLWLARLNGKTELGQGAGVGKIDLEDELDLDNSEATFNAELTLRFGDTWTARVSGYQFSTDDSGTYPAEAVRFGGMLVLPGDAFRASLDIDSYAAEVGYDVWHPVSDPTAELRVAILGGARYLEVRQTIELPGIAEQKGDGDWVAMYLGGEFELRLRPPSGPLRGRLIRFGASVAGGLDVNGDNGPYVQVRAGVTVEVVRHVSVNVGYRYMSAHLTDGDYTFDGGLRGLFVGGTLRF